MNEVEAPPKKLPDFRKPETSGSPKRTFKSLGLLYGLVGLVFLTIFWGMGWLAREDLSSSELFSRSLDGRQDSKRMSALEWARRLHLYSSHDQAENVAVLAPDPTQSQRLADVIRQTLTRPAGADSPDSTYLSGLATVIGFSRFTPPAALNLSEIFVSIPSREWAELQIPVMLSLARLAAPLDVALQQRFLQAMSDEDPALRKTAVFVVGALAKDEISRSFFRPKILELRSDLVSDVRWNAGFTLGRWSDPQAEPVLRELLDLAARVRRDGHLQDGEEDDVLTESLLLSFEQAFRLVAQAPETQLHQKLSVISKDHPHLKIRQAAISALKTR